MPKDNKPNFEDNPIEMMTKMHLYSQNCQDRELAADFLHKTRAMEPAKQLFVELGNKDRYVAIRAAWGLTLMRKEHSVPLIIKALNSAEPEISRHGGWGLLRISGPSVDKALVAALNDRRVWVRNAAASALRGRPVAKRPDVERALVAMLKRDLGYATITLGYNKTRSAMDALAAALEDKSFPSVSMAIQGLARNKDPRALQPALELLANEPVGFSPALWSLRLLDDTSALPRVIDYLGEGKAKGFNVQSAGMRALDSLKRTAGAEALLPLLDDKNWRVRLSVAVALGALATEKAVPRLIELLSDEHWAVRGSAAEGLGNAGGVRAFNPLIRALRDSSWYVRQHAALALGRIKNGRATAALLAAFKDRNEIVRVAAAEALAAIASPKIADVMIRALDDEHPGIRDAAAEALGKLKAHKAVPALICKLEDEPWSEKARAAKALGEIGDRRALGPLLQLLKDNACEVYLAAEKAIRQIKEPEPDSFSHLGKSGIA